MSQLQHDEHEYDSVLKLGALIKHNIFEIEVCIILIANMVL